MRGTNALLPGGGFDVDRLLAPGQALIAYFARAQLAGPKPERVALAQAWGRVLADSIVADSDYPAAARSSMDGFAVDSARTPGTFRIAGDVRMGSVWPRAVEPGAALRIPTGGSLPDGCDAVVPIEDALVDGESVRVDRAVPAGDCVQPRAADMRAGEPLLAAGTFVGAAELGVLATLGMVDVPTYRQPVFAVLSSGDELVEASASPALGQIRDSNRWAIAGALQSMGARVLHLPIVPDEPAAAAAMLRDALDQADGVILTGGSSVGARDLTPRIVNSLGEPGVIVHGLRVKPGKPTVLAAIDGKPVIGLPGNPTSALAILTAVAAPIVAALVGGLKRPLTIAGVLAEAYEKRAGWTWLVPVAVDERPETPEIRPLALHSGSVSLLARADGFLTLGEAVSSLPAGAPVRATRFFVGGS